MSSNSPHRFRRKASVLLILAGLSATTLGLAAASGQPGSAVHRGQASNHRGAKPTIVLVHGAFADSSGWADVTRRLQHRGYTVLAPANPLRGLTSDSAYISSILTTIQGPVVLVGHSYGGMVLTNAAVGHTNVKALVYIAAFAPDAGDTVGGLSAHDPGSELTPDNLILRPYPGGTDGYINPAVFSRIFAADLPHRQAAFMATSQRPADLRILSEPSGSPAWKTIPSWYMVASHDHTIPPATERFMAKRARATTVEVRSSHVAMISHPGETTELILDAVRSTR